MAKKTQKRKIVRLVSDSGATYYTKRRNDGEKLKLRKFDYITRQPGDFDEVKADLGRNVVKKRK